jgi:hypothetical protein
MRLSRAFQRTSRAWLLPLLITRLLVLLFSMQFGGLLHDATDVARCVAWAPEESEHEQCPPDRPCDDCPPGCPNCHCATAIGTLAVAQPMALVPQLLTSSLPLSLDRTQAPDGPELPSLFRPPRA